MKRHIKILKEEDVIGQQIKSVWFKVGSKGEKGWLDSFECWIELQNDLIFQIPGSGGAADWKSVELPIKAKQLEPAPNSIIPTLLRKVFKVKGRFEVKSNNDKPLVSTKIAAIYSRLYEDEIDTSLSSVIELSDGRAVTETALAPHGTGGTGIFIHSKEEMIEFKKNGMASFFTIRKNG